MEEPACDYNICECCGTEFGNDDELRTPEELRNMWIAAGAKWFFRDPPPFWNPWKQLVAAHFALPYRAEVSFSVAATVEPAQVLLGSASVFNNYLHMGMAA